MEMAPFLPKKRVRCPFYRLPTHLWNLPHLASMFTSTCTLRSFRPLRRSCSQLSLAQTCLCRPWLRMRSTPWRGYIVVQIIGIDCHTSMDGAQPLEAHCTSLILQSLILFGHIIRSSPRAPQLRLLSYFRSPACPAQVSHLIALDLRHPPSFR